MRGLYILDDNRNVLPCSSIQEWGEFMQNAHVRSVGICEFGNAAISTVFLGLDCSAFRGPPMVFETAFLNGTKTIVMERYDTWAKAEAGHAAAVEALGMLKP